MALLEKFKKEIVHILHTSTSSSEEAESIVLEKVKDQLNRSGSDLKSFNLPEPTVCSTDNIPKIIRSETKYDKEKLLKAGKENIERLTEEQRTFFESVIDSVNIGNGGLFCLNAAGGTGKTFTLNTLLDCIRGDLLLWQQHQVGLPQNSCTMVPQFIHVLRFRLMSTPQAHATLVLLMQLGN